MTGVVFLIYKLMVCKGWFKIIHIYNSYKSLILGDCEISVCVWCVCRY